jgi:CheY-like chemotaxis protein
MLKQLGYRPDVVANGQEVLEALERQRYDVVLMDVRMPEMDGIEATQRLKEKLAADCPRIVAMTASAMRADRERCLAAGMDDFVSKPIKIEDVEAAILRGVRRQ